MNKEADVQCKHGLDELYEVGLVDSQIIGRALAGQHTLPNE